MTDSGALDKRQEPLVPSHVSFSGYLFFPLDVKFVTRDKFSYLSGDAFKAAIQLMAAAWQERPAGSLPDDDKLLADITGFGRGPSAVAAWQAVKDEALCDFVLCSDGRYYSRYLAVKVMEAWKATEDRMARTKRGRETIAANKEREKLEKAVRAKANTATGAVTETATGTITESVTEAVTDSVADRREDKIRSEDRRGEGIREQKTGSDREGVAPLKDRVETDRSPKGIGSSRQKYEAFDGISIQRRADVVKRYADEYAHLSDSIQTHLTEIDRELSLVPKDQRNSRVRPMLDERNRAAAAKSDEMPF